jgi:hypothetical protein
VIDEHAPTETPALAARPAREPVMLGYFIAVAKATGALLLLQVKQRRDWSFTRTLH